jgi:hypothetical protein
MITRQVFAAPRDGNGGGDGYHHHHSSHHRSDSSSISNNNLPTSEPSPELTLGPATEPEPLDCTKNPDDILCKVDCTTNPDDPLCTPPSPPPTPEPAPELTNSTSASPQEFSFKETLEVSPNLKGVVISGPTNKFVDSIGAMHIVGELRNDGTKTLNVGQIVATIYGPSNRTLGLDYATPTPATLSPGQSGSFEFFVGGDQSSDGVSDLSQITRVKYHVGF